MIANAIEYEKACGEIRHLEERLERLHQSHPIGSKGFTKAGIRKMIARLHEELALYEGSEEAREPVTTSEMRDLCEPYRKVRGWGETT